tara:strand:- start:2962 stop:4767 length:1806 start_codon:yes stop_codon:yes gene_type:complete
MSIAKYNTLWKDGTHPLEIELTCIRYGGRWTVKGKPCGDGLFAHYMNARKLIWPERYRHKWTDIIYDQVLKNSITIFMGPASSQKTSHLSEMVNIAYQASPHNTAILVSSTTREKLRGAVFSEIAMLWQQGKSRFPFWAGHPIEYKMMITTDDVEQVDIRDERKGIIAKACFKGQENSSSNYVGLGVFAGIKQENFWFLADELQFMAPTFLDCIPNMRSNTGGGGLKVIGSGNPNHDPESQLSIIAEPLDGWASVENNTKTSIWPIKLHGGVCVNFIGIDSPNFDQDEDIYPKLIGHQFERLMRHDRGLGSPQYESQVMGRNKMALAKSRVITREICRDGKAHDKAVWQGTERIKVHYCDPAYGGGDRCISGWAEFGTEFGGHQIIRISPPRIVKVDVKLKASPEDQIAASIKRELDDFSIPADRSGYDSFGKGTMGNAFAKVFGNRCPVPIDAGQRPSTRPVRQGFMMFDEKTGMKRLKRCDEEYGKFITEMWFCVRNIIEAGQMRELPVDVMAEGCRREYETVAGGKIDVEPKDEMGGRSPDLFDWLAGICEMARRHGFVVGRLGADVVAVVDSGPDPLDLAADFYRDSIQAQLLKTAA